MNLNDQILEERKKYFKENFDFKEFKKIIYNLLKSENNLVLSYGEPKDHLNFYYLKRNNIYINKIYANLIAEYLKSEGFNVGIGIGYLFVDLKS